MHQQNPINYLIRSFITKGITGAVLLYFLILGLISMGMNTMLAQAFLKLIVVIGIVMWGNALLEKHFDDVKVFHRFFFGIGIGLTMSVVLTAFELVTLSIGATPLAPAFFQQLDIPRLLLSLSLSFELMGFSIIGALAALQYFKKSRREIQAAEAR